PHPLLDEAKTELDVGYDEFRRVETQVVSRASAAKPTLERDYAQIGECYRLQSRALNRFSVMSAAFGFAAATADPDQACERLRRMVFRPRESVADTEQLEADIAGFVQAMRAFMFDAATLENERAVRQGWEAIETRLRKYGRAL
ncbi:MAG: hypothetical protein ACFB2Z_06195, partial [Maricaulaceae bacterium]